MSADLMPFDYNGQPVRSVVIDGETEWVAADVCRVLEHSNPSAAVAGLDEDERGLRIVETPSGDQRMVTVTEPGLYSLISRSRKPEAKAFRRWITHTVLPQIRRTGSYGQPKPLSRLELIDLARDAEVARIAAEERNVELSGQVAQLTPDAEAWAELAAAEGDYDTRAAAQILCRGGVQTGQNRLRASLRQIGWTGRDNRPYQKHVDCGRMSERITRWTNPETGDEHVSYQLRITPKGIGELRDLLRGDRLRVIDGGAS